MFRRSFPKGLVQEPYCPCFSIVFILLFESHLDSAYEH
nr:MAG TPA: hypothetical protein [Caudoviricetes sp.]